MFPLRSRDPDGLARMLWARGFDATRYGSSLIDLTDSQESPSWIRSLVYLPMRPEMSLETIERMAGSVVDFETNPE